MKKIFALLFLCFAFLLSPRTYAIENIVSLEDKEVKSVDFEDKIAPIEIQISFDWLDISQAERDENIAKYKKLLFTDNKSHIYLNEEEFKNKFREYRKDKNFKHHYMLTNEGITEDEDAKYCAFYYRKKTLMMYAIQYKNNPHNAFYYSAFGKLYYIDITSDEYPNFPYTSMQYDKKGKLKSAIYFVSHDIQLMFDANREFQGIWYKDKMYDKNGKQILTRSNW